MPTRKHNIKKGNKTRRNRSSSQTLTCPTRSVNDKYQIGTSGFMVSQSMWFKFRMFKLYRNQWNILSSAKPKSN